MQTFQAADRAPERAPIFVGGLDRCGKTLMRLSLSAHPNIAMSRRTYMWNYFYNRYGNLKERANFERCLAAMLRHKPMGMLGPDAERIRREFWQGEPSYACLFALFHAHYAERAGKSRWGDQLGLIERYADPIFAAYPGARMIHMVRHPCDQYADSTAPADRRAGKAGAAAARWLSSIALAERNQRRYPGSYKVVRYESLASQREATLRDVCGFVGEVFVPAMVTLEGSMRFGEDRGHGSQPSPAPVSLSPRQAAFIEHYAARQMATLGYQPQLAGLTSRDRLAATLIDWPANLARAAAWRALEALQHRTPPQIGRRLAFGSMK